ncbi:hypothetical protein Q7P37_010267 [Cladosporium fusiforme]
MSDSPASGHFETGSLTQRAPQQTEFIGSSSGVHFIKLVRAGFTDEPIGVRHALREDGIVGEDDDDPDDATDRNSGLPPLPRANAPVLCDYLAASNDSSPLPSREEAQTMVVEYFQSWHPLLPFLYGPTFMRYPDGTAAMRVSNGLANGLFSFRFALANAVTRGPASLSLPSDLWCQTMAYTIISAHQASYPALGDQANFALQALVSRVLEIFHKSIHIRSVEKDKVLRIRADTNQWLNSLPHWPPRPGRPVLDQMGRPIKPEQSNFIPFLHILQQQLLIAIHRPYLSLPRSSAEFENSLQLVIRAARQTNTLLSEIDDYFWPGYLASAWMSGLLLIFACQNKAFSREQAVREINECLQTLQRMQSRWKGASRCHKALSALVITLTKTGDQEDTANAHPSSKRMQLHDEGDHVTPDPKRPCPSWSGISRDSGEGSSLPVAATTGLNWQNGTSILQTDIQPDFGIGTGDIFQNISWDGDFSSIDQFAMNGYSQDWLE